MYIILEGAVAEPLCEACGFPLAHKFEEEVIEGPRGDYTKRSWYYHCTNMNCPQQDKRKPLQKA